MRLLFALALLAACPASNSSPAAPKTPTGDGWTCHTILGGNRTKCYATQDQCESGRAQLGDAGRCSRVPQVYCYSPPIAQAAGGDDEDEDINLDEDAPPPPAPAPPVGDAPEPDIGNAECVRDVGECKSLAKGGECRQRN